MDRRRSRNREMTDILYNLKQSIGIPAELYRISVDSVNRATGERSVSRTCKRIKRLILFPERSMMKFQQSISYLAANKNFTYGAQFELGDRECIIDQKDLGKDTLNSDYNIEDNDYLVVDGLRYNMIDRIALDYGKGWYLHLRRTQGQPTYQIAEAIFIERPVLSESFAAEVN